MKIAWWTIPLPLLVPAVVDNLVTKGSWSIFALVISVFYCIVLGKEYFAQEHALSREDSMMARVEVLEMNKAEAWKVIQGLSARYPVPDAMEKIVKQLNSVTTELEELKTKYQNLAVMGAFGRGK